MLIDERHPELCVTCGRDRDAHADWCEDARRWLASRTLAVLKDGKVHESPNPLVGKVLRTERG